MEEKEVKGAPSIALRTLAVCILVAFAIGFIIGLITGRKTTPPCVNMPVVTIQRDTVTQRDTVQGKVQPPTYKTVIRVDTIKLQINPKSGDIKKSDTTRQVDTTRHAQVLPDGRVAVPIEQRTYVTADYRAVVSGWHPALDSITLYPKTTTIHETVTKLADPPRHNWCVAVGPSAVYTTDKRFVPGASVVLGFVIKSWH